MVEYYSRSRVSRGEENLTPRSESSNVSLEDTDALLDGEALTPIGSPWGSDEPNTINGDQVTSDIQ